jgi:hypothetical protein
MIGLSPYGARLYADIRAWHDVHGVPLNEDELRSSCGLSGWHVRRVLTQLVRRGFVTHDRTGRIIPQRPPHEIVVAEVCATMNLTIADITGPSHDSRLVRARRAIAKKLRGQYRYSARHIALVVNRHRTTIEEYSKPNYAAERSKRRSLGLYGQQVAA